MYILCLCVHKKQLAFFWFLFLAFTSSFLFAKNKIKEGSCFSVMGVVELRAECGFGMPVKYKTLAHEGGLKVKILQTYPAENHNEKSGRWLYVLITAPFWADDFILVEKYNKFWIFFTDDMIITDYAEY